MAKYHLLLRLLGFPREHLAEFVPVGLCRPQLELLPRFSPLETWRKLCSTGSVFGQQLPHGTFQEDSHTRLAQHLAIMFCHHVLVEICNLFPTLSYTENSRPKVKFFSSFSPFLVAHKSHRSHLKPRWYRYSTWAYLSLWLVCFKIQAPCLSVVTASLETKAWTLASWMIPWMSSCIELSHSQGRHPDPWLMTGPRHERPRPCRQRSNSKAKVVTPQRVTVGIYWYMLSRYIKVYHGISETSLGCCTML